MGVHCDLSRFISNASKLISPPPMMSPWFDTTSTVTGLIISAPGDQLFPTANFCSQIHGEFDERDQPPRASMGRIASREPELPKQCCVITQGTCRDKNEKDWPVDED